MRCVLGVLAAILAVSVQEVSAPVQAQPAGERSRSILESEGRTIAGPHLSGEEIIERRPRPQGEMLVLSYRTTTAENPQRLGRLLDWMQLRLAPTYGHVREVETSDIEGNATVSSVYDFALNRVYILDEYLRNFTNISLFSVVAEREQQFRTRLRTIQAQRQISGRDASREDKFWAQASAGLTTDDLPLEIAQTQRTSDGGVEAFLNGRLIASVQPSDQTWTRSERRAFVKMMRLHLRLHPSILALFNTQQTVPGRILIVQQENFTTNYLQLALQDAERRETALPFDARYSAGLDRDAGLTPDFVDKFGATMRQEVMTVAEQGHTPIGAYEDRMEAALERGEPVSALLIYNEAKGVVPYLEDTCRSGGENAPRACTLASRASRRASGDSDFVALARAASLDKNNYPGRAASVWMNMTDVDDFDGGVMLDLAVARAALDTLDRSRARRDDDVIAEPVEAARYRLLRALERAPQHPGVYAEIGEYYRVQGDLISAWVAYDLARALPGSVNITALRDISDMEAAMLGRRSGYFGL